MSMACETLFNWIRNGSLFGEGERIAYLNAVYYPDFSDLTQHIVCVQQPFKPFAQAFEEKGIAVSPALPEDMVSYDVVWLLLPKNVVEAEFYIAVALRLLKVGGMIVCAADNKAGGARLKKMLQKFGLEDLESESRNKARVVSAKIHELNQDYVGQAYDKGRVQRVLDNRFSSEPGIFGWNKIDKGSEILAQCLPRDLKGKGADFGCGYGYLSDFILSHCPKVKRLHALDADYRAVQACQENLKAFDCETDFIWCDLTKSQTDLRNLDFVVMNPPFHEGKKANNAIGQAFIQSAYASLKRGGRLWMVANNHLPYENVLDDVFFQVTKHHEGQGFKVYEAVR